MVPDDDSRSLDVLEVLSSLHLEVNSGERSCHEVEESSDDEVGVQTLQIKPSEAKEGQLSVLLEKSPRRKP